MFVAYLWGIETIVSCKFCCIEGPFVAYLWGIETTYCFHCRKHCCSVCSLPMRNWNTIIMSYLMPNFAFVAYLWGIETKEHIAKSDQTRKFVAYLWGIETMQDRIGSGAGKQFVAYLWGIETNKMLVLTISFCPFVAYLWGIETLCRFTGQTSTICVCSLPMRNWNILPL